MGDDIVLNATCQCCGKRMPVRVRLRDYSKWRHQGCSVNESFPYLNNEEKDLLLTGYCQDCLVLD